MKRNKYSRIAQKLTREKVKLSAKFTDFERPQKIRYSPPGRKIAKDRITFMLCANVDGSHKLKPLIIGKSANPRCLKGFENPLEYANSQKSWINSELFFRWFHHSFIKQVRKFSAENNLPPRALLLIDNCTAHKPIDKLQSDDANIAAMLLPPNVTAVLQPMDQNTIRLVKLEYRAKLLWNIVAQENIPVENILKGHSIRDAILLLKLAWDELPRAVLIKAWKNIKQWDDDQYDSEDEIPLLTLIRSNSSHDVTLREVQSLLSKVGGVDVSSEDIENWNDDQNTEDDEDFEVSDNEDFEVSDNEDEEPVVEEDMQQQK
ncbi:PREDICTED: jerky protein homolog-like, partial [Bactrocera latifrons]|uniref:jerky protein homolog-like n=1 Tax=Bactrocera latifrons TaxID=174628 RepID=UPI0008DDA2D9